MRSASEVVNITDVIQFTVMVCSLKVTSCGNTSKWSDCTILYTVSDLLLFVAVQLSLCASSPYTSTDKTDKNKYTLTKKYKNTVKAIFDVQEIFPSNGSCELHLTCKVDSVASWQLSLISIQILDWGHVEPNLNPLRGDNFGRGRNLYSTVSS